MASEIWTSKWRTWSGSRSTEGYRTYQIKWLIKADFDDGPHTVLNTPGLPVSGSVWNFGNDFDAFATCLKDADIRVHQEKEGDKNRWWTIQQTFSSKPLGKCTEAEIEDPLLEPQKVSGNFVKAKEEASFDRFGLPILNSAHERMHGPSVEFDANKPQIVIEQNVADLQIELFAPMIDTLNAFPLWGLPARTIKLSDAPWEKRYWGTCSEYYSRRFTFDVNAKIDPNTLAVVSGFDRDVLDEGTKVLRGKWDTDKNSPNYRLYIPATDLLTGGATNPANFIKFQDINGNFARVILNGAGRPYNPLPGTADDDEPGKIHVEKFRESNFLLLGIPTTF